MDLCAQKNLESQKKHRRPTHHHRMPSNKWLTSRRLAVLAIPTLAAATLSIGCGRPTTLSSTAHEIELKKTSAIPLATGQIDLTDANSCSLLFDRARSAANWIAEQCKTYMPIDTTKTVVGEIALMMKVLGADVPPHLLIAVAGATTVCRLAELAKAIIDLQRSTCSAEEARLALVETTRQLCTRINSTARSSTSAFPSWCPDKRKSGLYYCYGNQFENGGPAPCVVYGKYPVVVGYLSEFTAYSEGELTFNGTPRRVRRTSANGQSCFVPAHMVRCSQ